MSAAPPEDDHQLAVRAADEAGAVLLALREQMAGTYHRWDLMDSGDVNAHRCLMALLGEARPGDAILSEEGADDRRRLQNDRVWIVDPLDGTNEYGDPDRPDWAVHVALWERGELTAAAVAMPALGVTLSTRPAPLLPPVTRDRPRIVTSRYRPPHAAIRIANALGCDAIRVGSAGVKAMMVVLGEGDIYVHDGGMYQWDSAAPAAVAAAAGLHVSRIDGSPLVYNQPDPWLPDFLICRPELAESVLHAMWGDRRRR